MTTEAERIKKTEYIRKWREKNKEHLEEYRKKYYSGEEFLKYRRAYYQEHKEEIYASQTKYRHKNSKKVSQMVIVCKRKRYDKLKSEGVCNAWAVINYCEEPRYTPLKKGRPKKKTIEIE